MPDPVVALIHATTTSMRPAEAAFADRFPAARLWHLLDDRLITEADAAGRLTPALRLRMNTLIRYAVDGGAQAVLLSCSMYGPVAVDGDWPVPVHASDQALFARIGQDRPARVTVLGPLASGVADTVTRLTGYLSGAPARPLSATRAKVSGAANPVQVRGAVVDGAAAATRSGDGEALAAVLIDAARRAEPDADAIVLGQYSIGPALPTVAAAVSVPVLGPAHLAVDAVRAALVDGRPQ